jgi:iron complex transport system substrate-binding protein
METQIAASEASVKADASKKFSVYYEVSTDPYYSLTSQTFIGSIMKQMGLVNIADAQSTTADAGYPSLSSEYIVKSNPSIIVLAGDASVASVAKRAGWSGLSAVKNGNVVDLDPNVASQWGTRLPTLVAAIAAEIAHAAK